MTSQIPDIVFCVSLARTPTYTSPLGSVSVHHIPTDLFFGYESSRDGDVLLASPENALLDFFYLSRARSRLFAALPEMSLPAEFKIAHLRSMTKKVPDQKRRSDILSAVTRLPAE